LFCTYVLGLFVIGALQMSYDHDDDDDDDDDDDLDVLILS